ncbi:MAG: NAD(P)H-hydrate dehydratase [Chloroflexota bacterium]|nr:MAG: NAD(P)H-hydrate dehydratase [Chloroflexota bacterium]
MRQPFKVIGVGEMRDIERRAAEAGLPGSALMEIAGRAFADALVSLPEFQARAARTIVVLVGPGNNGGDGLVAARHLAMSGRPVFAILARARADDVRADLAREAGASVLDIAETDAAAANAIVAQADVVIDALLGIGRSRPMSGAIADLARLARAATGLIVGLDVPSGLDADTGLADPGTPRCDITITLGALKRGLILGDGPNVSGRIVPIGIGVPRRCIDADLPDALDAESVAAMMPGRSPSGHKGTYGRTLVIGGSASYPGAAFLAALGAVRGGAGIVTLASVESVLSTAPAEVTRLNLGDGDWIGDAAVSIIEETLEAFRSVVIGPGLGRNDATAAFVRTILPAIAQRDIPGVVDADALAILSYLPDWPVLLPPRSILTPHPGEFARLTGTAADTDRLNEAAAVAERWRTTVVLKGAYTVIAAPRRLAVSPFANPILATGGTGDVLSGVIGALLAQGADPFAAAACGVFLHGRAAEILAGAIGNAGALAREIADAIPRARRRLPRSR